jgi:hypothetical protein
MKHALNVGCGNDYRASTPETEWVNQDISTTVHTDVNCDIKDIDKHFGENYFDYVLAVQVLEHISRDDFPAVIRALYRVSAHGCLWSISVPHGFSDNFITDPTHKMPFSTRTFDYFIEGRPLRDNGIIYGWADVRLEEVSQPSLDGNQSINFRLMVIK